MGIRGAGICLFNHRSVLLVHQRASQLWGFPKGSIHEFETVDECWRRELFEETGLAKVPRFNFSYTTQSHEYTVIVAQFLSPILPGVRANDDEILESKWVPIREVFDLSLNALTRRVMFSYPLYHRYIRPKLSEETIRELEGGDTPEVPQHQPEVTISSFFLPAGDPKAFSLFAIPCERFPLGISCEERDVCEKRDTRIISPARCQPSPSTEIHLRRLATS